TAGVAGIAADMTVGAMLASFTGVAAEAVFGGFVAGATAETIVGATPASIVGATADASTAMLAAADEDVGVMLASCTGTESVVSGASTTVFADAVVGTDDAGVMLATL